MKKPLLEFRQIWRAITESPGLATLNKAQSSNPVIWSSNLIPTSTFLPSNDDAFTISSSSSTVMASSGGCLPSHVTVIGQNISPFLFFFSWNMFRTYAEITYLCAIQFSMETGLLWHHLLSISRKQSNQLNKILPSTDN